MSQAVVETAVEWQIQVVCFGLLLGVISGLYHKVLIWLGRPRGPLARRIARTLCVVFVLAAGLVSLGPAIGSGSTASMPGVAWSAFAIGIVYGAMRVLGTAIIFRRVRYLIAGRIEAPASPLRRAVEVWTARAVALLLMGVVGFWAFQSRNIYQFGATGIPPLLVLLLFSGMFWPVDKDRLNLGPIGPTA